jgi:CRISPR-associated protein Csb2
MPTVLHLRFPARHYHATPWGHHVNEGQVEWPPAPWRLLRALLATGFAKLDWPPEGPPLEAARLVERLAAVLPTYRLPPASTAHTRHYVDAADKKPLIFDAWAQISASDVVEVVWPVELTADERTTLDALARAMGYLGRAESWVDARLAEAPEFTPNCVPATHDDGPPGPGFESVHVLCPVPADRYAAWYRARLEPIQAEFAPPPGKRPTAAQQKKLAAAVAPYPVDLVDALCAETTRLQRDGWTVPPGSRDVVYWRRTGALAVGQPVARTAPKAEPVEFVLLAVSTPSRGRSALPPLHRVFPQGRLLHRAIASVIGHQMDADPDLARALLGRDGARRAVHDHRHAHLLYLDLDGDARLDHVLVHAPGGLSGRAVEALRRLRKTYMKGGAGELQVVVSAAGDAQVLRGMAADLGTALERVLGPVGGATEWVSETPWVPPRNLKRGGKNTLEGVLRMEAEVRGLPPIAGGEVLDADALRSQRHFVLHDDTARPPRDLRLALRLRFEAPVMGPVCLGYGAHYGLGRFVAASGGVPTD